ncbi:hypothetical protein PUR53_00185, partial [Streptomyces sp. SP18BB07]|nr:hypothetical protein [Streptomyces sp. SP18BB07]
TGCSLLVAGAALGGDEARWGFFGGERLRLGLAALWCCARLSGGVRCRRRGGWGCSRCSPRPKKSRPWGP